jgi:predicted nuclease with TOPRIM domain
MDLYQPLFVQRPVVEPELFASLRPPTYSGAMEKSDLANGEVKQAAGLAPRAPGNRPQLDSMGGRGARDEAALFLRQDKAKDGKEGRQAMDPKGSAPSAAVATDLGDFFQYQIEHPVTLARQKSALLPIVNEDVDATRVSIYNPATHPKFPLLGLQFKNTTALHLMQGPVTVFDGTAYAGDARIQDLQPKEDRLLSYAIDLGTEVESTVPHTPERLTKVVVRNGLIQTTHRFHQEKVYQIKNRSEQDRTLIIEHPYRADLTLTAPEKFSERARDVYRFELPVKAHGVEKLTVAEERDLVNNIALSNADDNTFTFFLSSQLSSPEVKKALQAAADRKGKLQEARRELAHLDRQWKDIREDQNRLREDLKVVPETSAAHKRYVEKFDKQESEIEQLQGRIKELQNAEHRQSEEFNRFLATLNVD